MTVSSDTAIVQSDTIFRFGYDQGVMSGLLTGSAFTNQFPEIDTTPGGNGSSSLQGTVVAIYEIVRKH